MINLERILQELCPDGVEFKPIKEVYQRVKGTPITAAKMKEIESTDGEVRIFAGGKTAINAHEEDIPKANITRVPAVLVQSRGIIDAVYYKEPFTFKNEMWAYTHKEKIAVKFLYYILKNNMSKFREAASGMGSLPQISLKITEDFEMPVPPLEVQSEIVRILDNFTELTNELTEELTEELTARQKQYEYYRDILLERNHSNAQQKLLNEISDVRDGTHDSPKQAVKGFPLVTSKNISGGRVNLSSAYLISEEDYSAINKRSKVDKDDILFSMIGTVGEIAVAEEPVNYAIKNVGLIKTRDNLLSSYLKHYLKSSKAQKYIFDNMKGTAPKYLSLTSLRNFPVVVPERLVMSRIVEVLDNFDAICSDLKIGLPAEIEARASKITTKTFPIRLRSVKSIC